ncbi:MAG: hypothetical protein WD334_02070 [Chitinophagales bacterium]
MNFLSHYYFEKNCSPEFLVGLILPDLFPGFNQKLRRNIRETAPGLKSGLEIRKGIACHIRQDKAFHSSGFFQEREIYYKAHLHLPSFEKERSRPYLFRHIYLEMLMDRVLIVYKPKHGPEFFEKLALLKANHLSSFFKEIDRAKEVIDFFAIFNRFLSSKFLLNYIDNDFFIKALIRSYKRVVPYISFDNSDLKALHLFLEKDNKAFELEIIRFFNKFEY